MTLAIPFDNSYARLPDAFFARIAPTPVAEPALVKINHALALQLGIDPAALETPEGIAVLAGKQVASGSDPIATAYAGHQFGQFSPQLGDGRAILLGEVVDKNGVRYDIQLKGSGPTPFSRRGDGRAALGPVLREYIISEAMAALGVPTTRSLAAVTTGENILRDTILPGAVLTRVATSHIRVGTFQFFAARRDYDSVKRLADYTMARHYPETLETPQPYRAFLDAVIARQAKLIAQWMHIGFIHGVMNTDNCAIGGETIDYGPCAFMDAFDPMTVYSSIDHGDRYAYGKQPSIAHWNLARFAECLLTLFGEDTKLAADQANEALSAFPSLFKTAYEDGLRKKAGLTLRQEDDGPLIQDLLNLMAANKADFTMTFRLLAHAAADEAALGPVRDLFIDPTAFDPWAARWRARIAQEEQDGAAIRAAMLSVNPLYVPRNYLVEKAIEAAVSKKDFSVFEELLVVLAKPFDERPEFASYADVPPPRDPAYQTFCGT